MLPLQASVFPASASALRDALTEGFAHFGLQAKQVAVAASAFPKIENLLIDLTGAMAQRRPVKLHPGAAQPGALQVASLVFKAEPLQAGGVPIRLHLQARDAELREHLADGPGRVLTLQRAAEGTVSLEIAQPDLQRLVHLIAQEAAKGHGAEISELRLELNAISPRVVELKSEVVAKFGFVKATLRLTGRAELDDQLQLHLSQLDLQGSGMAAGLATSFLRPQLEKLQRRPISLAALPLGEIRLRDVRLTTGEQIRLEAQFGE